MDRSSVINLIAKKPNANEFGLYDDYDSGAVVDYAVAGDAVAGSWTIKKTEVYCDVRSITRTEWFEAGRDGIAHPAYIFVINRYEYGGEQIVEYDGKQYGVYRTYEAKNDNLELYAEAKGGTHVGS